MSDESLGSVFVDLTELDQALADVEERARRLEPAFRALRRPMRGDQRDHQKKTQGPEGPWAPRSPATLARLARDRRRKPIPKALRTIAPAPRQIRRRRSPRNLLGRLPNTLRVTSGPLFVRASPRVPWAIAHLRGGRVGRRRRVRLVARNFLWLSDALLENARSTIAGFVVKGWKR